MVALKIQFNLGAAREFDFDRAIELHPFGIHRGKTGQPNFVPRTATSMGCLELKFSVRCDRLLAALARDTTLEVDRFGQYRTVFGNDSTFICVGDHTALPTKQADCETNS